MLPQALKLKVIQQYEAGKLQKDIARDLGISTGSVSMILKASKDKHSDSIPREQPSVVAKDLQIISQPPSSYKKEHIMFDSIPASALCCLRVILFAHNFFTNYMTCI